MRRISQDFCGGAEISSSRRIGGDNVKRLKFVDAISNLPFSYYALVINKDRVPKDSGLQFKPTFYKYINRMLYENIARSGQNLRVIADHIGGQDFMDSFVPYLESHGRPSLFQDFRHGFSKSEETPLIQLADLVAGTLSYCFDPLKQNDYSPRFRELLRSHEIGIQCWPWEGVSVEVNVPKDGTLDEMIRRTMTHRVTRFLDEHQRSNNLDRQMQYSTLSDLFFARQFEAREKQALVSDDLISRLKNYGFEVPSKQYFLSRVIGAIRLDGIILAGSPDGYRLALSVADINDYLNHDRNVIEPMLSRVRKARESVSVDTANQYDILGSPNYSCMKALADTFQDFQIQKGTMPQEAEIAEEEDGV